MEQDKKPYKVCCAQSVQSVKDIKQKGEFIV